MVKFYNFWYPDFIGISYLVDDKELVICPYFDDMEKAQLVYDKISQWNHNFIKIRFIEYDVENYAFIAYQDPQGSFEKLNFGLYRSWMKIGGNYSNFKNKLNSSCKFAIIYFPNLNTTSKFKMLGTPTSIKDCRILKNKDLEKYPIEQWAHRICHGKEDIEPPKL